MVSEGEPDGWLFLLFTVAAVVFAPICEEIIFRLLLQGWLEKYEDDGVRSYASEQTLEAVTSDDGSQTVAPHENDANADAFAAAIEPTPAYNDPTIKSSQPVDTPHGWVAIVISAAFFGLAHLGYGPEPIPLFFLALVLGYLYNRTHRIVPSMVAHALFNAYSMIALWRMVFCDHAGMQ